MDNADLKYSLLYDNVQLFAIHIHHFDFIDVYIAKLNTPQPSH